MTKKYFEYRGVDNAVYAEVLSDTSEGISFGNVKDFTGLSEVGKTTESNNDTHYYDNLPAIVISSTGADTIDLNTSGIPLDVLSDITGQYYDATTGMFVEQERTPKYYALGYRTKTTDGTYMLVWRLKGMFSIPTQTSPTEDDGTDANGQTLTYTGVSTVKEFTATGKPAKAITIDTSINGAMTKDQFFAQVQTPDTIAPVGPTYVYTPVTPVGTENPSQEGWYERVNDNYVLTEDTTVDSEKTYYTRSIA